jgi:phosphomannomutase
LQERFHHQPKCIVLRGKYHSTVPLIKSVSGIRGTIGGKSGENLTPPDIVAFVSAYGQAILSTHAHPTIVVGRDGRISGQMVKQITITTLQSLGIDVIDLDYSTTPSVEMYVKYAAAQGGIIITASHNPAEWNALKFLNEDGEFISADLGRQIIAQAETGTQMTMYASVDKLGSVTQAHDAITHHINAILSHPLVDPEVIAEANFTVVLDAINSTGAIGIPPLMEALGVKCHVINGEVTGQFAHNPEPLPEHLTALCAAVTTHNAHLGISVDPDVDRLALVDERGVFFGEEYTLVCVADYVLQHQKGDVVTNLSSSMALRDLAHKYGVECHFAPVGEVHVVNAMKRTNAVIGGEGNGGIIDPSLHYGRDSLIGIALVLMQLATSGKSLSELKSGYPEYHMVKDKISFDPGQSPQAILDKVARHFSQFEVDTQDGLKIYNDKSWVQLRKSNTEPILRIYAEATTPEAARALVDEVRQVL